MNYIKQLITLAVLPILIGCSKTNDLLQNEQDIFVKLTHSYSGITSTTTSDEGEKIMTLKYFICDEGKVTVISSELAGYNGLFKLNRNDITPTSKIYVIANYHLSASVKDIAIGSSESLLASLQTAQSENNGQIKSIAMSAVSSLDDPLNGKVMILQLKRNMARFDLKIQPDVGIEVVEVTIQGLATASSIFETGVADSQNSANYSCAFDAPLTESVEGLFYAHPQSVDSRSAVAEIDVRYNGRLMTLNASIGEIKRNCIHNISVTANLGTVSLNVHVSGWEEGDSDVSENTDLTLKIDKTLSVLEEGATLLNDGMLLNLPCWGANATIVLKAPPGVVLKNVNGVTDDFAITSMSEDGLRYRITTSKNNRTNGDKKAIILNFAHPSDIYENDFRIVVVIDNYAPFPVVIIDDLEWMHYNASGKDPNGYPLASATASVREMYQYRFWPKFTGKSYQWGPRPGRNGVQIALDSWGTEEYGHQVLANINGAIIETPGIWEGTTVPCPTGWRIPTYQEYQSIWPPNGTLLQENIPTPYTTQTGKKLSAVIETFGGTYLSNITFSGEKGGTFEKARNLIISNDKFEILFPIGGYRKGNGTFQPTSGGSWISNTLGTGLGQEVFYWCADLTLFGRYLAVGMSKKVIQNYTGSPYREHNAWYHVRCVREKNERK